MANLYTVKVRYSLVEQYQVLASSEDEANAKVAADIGEHKLTPVGCAYGDMKAEIISTKCDYKEAQND